MEANPNNLIWPQQVHFMVSAQVTAESLFSALDGAFQPSIFLIGIPIGAEIDARLIRVVPSDGPYNAYMFKDVPKIARELVKVHEDASTFYTGEGMKEIHANRMLAESYKRAIEGVLDKESFRSDQSKKYVSWPKVIEEHLVFTVLELDKKTLSKYYSLRKTTIDGRLKISTSFLSSCISTFLEESVKALDNPYQGIDFFKRNGDELIRLAGRTFMYTISQAGKNFDGLHGLYEACNEISAMKYEGAEGIGNMIICEKDHENISFTLQLEDPIRIRDYRRVRKFLELSDASSSIICDSFLIYGLGNIAGNYNSPEESLFKINFYALHSWIVEHDGNTLMQVEYRQPSLPKQKITKGQIDGIFKRIFHNVSANELKKIWSVVLASSLQKHGTMLVISDDAEAEAERLRQQSFKVTPFQLNENNVLKLTSIDGALILNRQAICYGLGVILDGLSIPGKGDSSRGARYNSAIRYFEHAKKTTNLVILIVSEDGMVNIIPNLMPQINHKELLKHIEAIQGLIDLPNPSQKEYNKHLSYLNEKRFYLTEEECGILNEAQIAMAEKKIDRDALLVAYSHFIPNPEMNKSYYIE